MSRYFNNPFLGTEQSAIPKPIEFKELIKQNAGALLYNLESKLQTEVGQWKDHTVYTGTMGIALMYWHLYELQRGEVYLQKAHQLLARSVKHLGENGISFLHGDAGTLTIAILVANKMNDVTLRQDMLQRLRALGNVVLQTGDPTMANEYLFGRAGYLYAVLFVNRKIPGIIDTAFITKIARVLIDEGKKGGYSCLYYEWQHECYLGAIHGIAGIVYALLNTWNVLNDDDRSWVRKTLEWLLTLRHPTGNMPSSLGSSKDDILVQFCHGAPGVIYTFLLAHKILQQPLYIDAAIACGEQIWLRGLLRKGYSICHGVAGNAYGFLALYEHTKDLKYLSRACIFARWCFDYGKYAEHTPDHPLSMFEGQAGVVYMLSDIGFNSNPKFPGFEL